MSNTVNQLRVAVAGFVQRPVDTFIRRVLDVEHDVLMQACNNTRLYAERLVDFEYSKCQFQLDDVSILDGGSLDDAVVMGTDTPVSIKKLLSTFIPTSTGDPSTFPVDLVTKGNWVNRLKRKFDLTNITDPRAYPDTIDYPVQVMQSGKTVALLSSESDTYPSGTFTLYGDCIQWLPQYSVGTENDFLLDFAFDWMMYRTIQEINYFLKEDERVALSKHMVNDSWDALVKWNNELVQAAVDDLANLT